jgi:signal peptidase II
VDFIDIGIGDVRFWTFNVADSAVTIGALVLAWSLSREERETTAVRTATQRDVDAASGAPGPDA